MEFFIIGAHRLNKLTIVNRIATLREDVKASRFVHDGLSVSLEAIPESLCFLAFPKTAVGLLSTDTSLLDGMTRPCIQSARYWCGTALHTASVGLNPKHTKKGIPRKYAGVQITFARSRRGPPQPGSIITAWGFRA
jgi:hypothetical protein